MNFAAIIFLLVAAATSAFKVGFKIPRVVTNALIGTTVAIGVAGNGVIAHLPGFNLAEESFIVHAKEIKSVFEGNYNDPNHPGCLRKISVKDKQVTIVGSDNIDGSIQWVIKAKEDLPGTMFVDFSPKGGPENLLGVYDETSDSIKWPDGNAWAKIGIKK